MNTLSTATLNTIKTAIGSRSIRKFDTIDVLRLQRAYSINSEIPISGIYIPTNKTALIFTDPKIHDIWKLTFGLDCIIDVITITNGSSPIYIYKNDTERIKSILDSIKPLRHSHSNEKINSSLTTI